MAGFIAGLVGKKAIYWDLMKQHRHPLYKLGLNKNIVFRKFREIEVSLKEFSIGKIELGNHEEIVKLIDPFRDGKGGERVGSVIRKFLQELDCGSSKNKAVEVAVEEFRQKWGYNKVTKFGQLKENRSDTVWSSIRNDIRKSIKNDRARESVE